MGICQSVKRPTQPVILKFHWLELHQITASISRKPVRCIFFRDTLTLPPLKSGFIRKEEGMNEFGVGYYTGGVICPSKMDTCLLR